MRVKLLAFFLVWVTTVAADVQTQPTINCLHDGYPNPKDATKCICRSDGLFSGDYCQNRIVFNDGVLRRVPNGSQFDIGAICPPGFIGANCQPVKCVGGQSQAFYSQPADQMVSFYITYNLNMQGKANSSSSDDVLDAICRGFANSGTGQFLYYTPELGRTVFQGTDNTTTYTNCIKSFNSNFNDKCLDYPEDDNGNDLPPVADDCPSSTSLNFDLLNKLLDSTIPNSELYLVTNYPAETTDFLKIPAIVRKAISRRIRIHVFVFLPPYLMSENDYVRADYYQALRTLAESTLGVFVTPYSGVRLGLLGQNTVSDSITAMMDLKRNNFVPTTVVSSAIPGLYVITLGSNPAASYDYYISIRTEDIPRPDGTYSTLTFSQRPDGWTGEPLVDTGNWKLYKMNTDKQAIFFAQDISALKTPVDWVIYTQKTPILFTAVKDVNDVNSIDAASPYGTVNSGPQSLVAYADTQSKVTEISYYIPAFNVIDGTQGRVFLSPVIYDDDTSSVSPFFCTGSTSSQQSEIIAEFEMIEDSTDTKNRVFSGNDNISIGDKKLQSGQTCVDSPTLPDTRSEISSVLFVVDKAAGLSNPSISLSSPATLPGIQITVVQYDCKGVSTVLLGSDPTKLTAALTQETDCGTGSNPTYMPDAIIQALDSQVAKWVLLAIFELADLSKSFTEKQKYSEDWLHNEQIFVYLLAMVIVEIYNSWRQSYYINYIWNVVPRSMVLTTTVAQTLPRLSVVQTGYTEENLPIDLANDVADVSAIYTVYYVHTKLWADVAVDRESMSPFISGERTKITRIVWSGTSKVLSITGPTAYSIEKMTTVLLAYGFQSSGNDEALKLGLSYGAPNYLSFYTSRSTLYDSMNDFNFPYVIMSKIKKDNSIDPSVNYAVTRKNEMCRYSYYTTPVECDENTLGFVAQFITYTQDIPVQQRLEQKVVLCADAGAFTTAAPPTTPVPTTTAPPSSRGYAFIIDTHGGDPNLFAMSQETVTDFLKAYSADETFIFLTDQQGNGTFNSGNNEFVPSSAANVNNAFDVFTQQRIIYGDNSYANPAPAFNAIQAAFADANYDIKEMFYLTQTGVLAFDTNVMDGLISQGIPLSTVLYIATLSTVSTNITEASLKDILKVDPCVVNNTKAAVSCLVYQAPTPTYYTLPPIPTPREYACVKKAQAGIFLSFETSLINDASGLSNVTMNKTYAEFLQLFPSDFELGDAYKYNIYPQYSTDPYGCTVNTSRFEAQTLISGWTFFGIKMNSQAAYLCFNNFPSLASYIKIPSPDRSGTPQWDRISYGVRTNLDQNCMCTRMNDTNTLKIVVWLVFTVPDPAQNPNPINVMTDGNNFLHIILAFGPAASDPAGSFYYTLAQTSVTKAKDYYGYENEDPQKKIDDFFLNANGKTTEYLVSFVYDTICKIQKIDGSRTPTYGNTEYFEEFWRQEHSENLMRP